VKWNNNQKHSQIISSSRDNTVKLWDADNGSMIYSLSLPGVTMLHWNNDINTKFLISSPSSIGIIDMETGTCIRSFYFEKDEFSNSCVVWNQEGNKIVAAKNDVIIIYQLIVPVIPSSSSSSSTAAVATSDSHPSAALPPGIVNPITLPMHPQLRSMSPSTQQILKSPSLSGKLHPPPPPTLPLDEY
jgi:WD40 repeat protein